LNIHIGVGLDDMKFGMSEENIVDIYGKPDKIYLTEDENTRYVYNELLLELSFEKENNNLLGWIEVHNPNALLKGQQLIHLTKEKVLSFLSTFINEEPEIDDYGSFLSITYNDIWLELQFSFDRLRNINFGDIFDK